MEGVTVRVRRLGCGFGSRCLAVQCPAEASRHGEEFVLANFVVGSRIGGVERGDGQFMDGLAGDFAEAGEDNITGKDPVGGGITAGDSLAMFGFRAAVFGGRHCQVLVLPSQAKTYVYYHDANGRGCQGDRKLDNLRHPNI